MAAEERGHGMARTGLREAPRAGSALPLSSGRGAQRPHGAGPAGLPPPSGRGRLGFGVSLPTCSPPPPGASWDQAQGRGGEQAEDTAGAKGPRGGGERSGAGVKVGGGGVRARGLEWRTAWGEVRAGRRGCRGRGGVGREQRGRRGAEWREGVGGSERLGAGSEGRGRRPGSAGPQPAVFPAPVPAQPGSSPESEAAPPGEAGPGLTSASSLKSPHPRGTLKAAAPESPSLARVGAPAATQLSAASEGSSGCWSLASSLQPPRLRRLLRLTARLGPSPQIPRQTALPPAQPWHPSLPSTSRDTPGPAGPASFT